MDLLDPLVDGELPPGEARLVMNHVTSCSDCRHIVEEMRCLSRDIRALPLHAPRTDLAEKISALLARTTVPSTQRRPGAAAVTSLIRRAAPVGLGAVLGAFVVYLTIIPHLAGDLNDREIVSAHIRSMMGREATAVTSTDGHVLGPWFTGKLDFAPRVVSLESQGFHLEGARTDYLFGCRVAALVYKRRNHSINLFVVLSKDGPSWRRRSTTRNGFNIEYFSGSRYRYAAVSDVNRDELGTFVGLIANRSE